MRTSFVFLLTATLLAFAFAAAVGAAEEAKQDLIPASFSIGEGQVLIELFTSEGCSSCPPADKMFGALVAEARAEGHDIHLISWHVDYWDKLKTSHGVWKDPYSNPSYTRRQQIYAGAFTKLKITEKPLLVTPQMVVNGRPYRQLKAKGADTGTILAGMAKLSGGVEITATAKPVADGTITVDWAMAGAGWNPAFSLTIVAVEGDLTSKITKGENHGKTMVHHNVVRAASQGAAKQDSGSTTLTLPADWQGKRAAVLIAVHDQKLILKALKRIELDADGKPLAVAPVTPGAAGDDPVAKAIDEAGTCGPGGCSHE